MPTVKKKMPSKSPLNGLISVSMALRYSVSASSRPAMKAPSAIDRLASAAMTPVATITNRMAAMKRSLDAAPATSRNSGRKSRRPTMTMTAIASTACASASSTVMVTEPPLRLPRIVMKINSGTMERSCASRMAKLARPVAVAIRPCCDRSSMMIAVEDRDRHEPMTTATDGERPSSSKTPLNARAETIICRLPSPKTSRRMAISRS